MAHDVFISYAEEDQQTADAVCRALEEAGVRCWYAPRDVPYAVDYEDAIIDAISESKLMLLILSAHSNNSAHVKRELQNACREEPQVPVLPFQIENITLNKALRYYIGSVQWMSALTPPLETHLKKLATYVQSRLPQSERKDSTGQNSQPTEPEVKAGAEEDERRLGKENRQLLDVANTPIQRPAEDLVDRVLGWLDEKRIRGVAGWLDEKPIRGGVAILVISVAIILIAIFGQTGQRPEGPTPTPTSTPQPIQQPESVLTAVEYARRGDEMFRQRKYDEAEAYRREAVRLSPGNALYQHKLGESLYRQQKYEEAELAYREATRLRPYEALFHFSLGTALKEQKKYAEAEQAYREAMRLDPADAAIRNYLGDVLYIQSRFAEAGGQYSIAATLDPSNAVYYYNLGSALFAQGKSDQAKIQYEKAAQLDPNNTQYREALKTFQ